MTEKTEQELIYRAMSELGRLRAGEAPDAGDYADVLALVDPLVDQLNAEEVAYIDNSDAIDPKWFLPLARLLAIEAGPLFGTDAIQNLLTYNRAPNLDALREREHQVMRRIKASHPTGESQKAVYF